METLFADPNFLAPELSWTCQSFFRIVYGVLLFGTLTLTIPQWRRFFLTDKWSGYAEASPFTSAVQNPLGSALAAIVWFACAVSLIVGFHTLTAAAVNLLLCRYFFIQMRWRGVLRGMGAPGFMSYWLAVAVFLLELSSELGGAVRQLAILVLQVDFAFIMFSAGFYKLTAGYAQNEGMEYGMVNPEWGYWWQTFRKMTPNHWLFHVLNHLAWSTELVAAALMIVPQTRFIGGMLILLSFIFIATQIRLGLLCEMVMLGCVLFFHPGSFGDLAVNFLMHGAPVALHSAMPVLANAQLMAKLVRVALCAYLIMLPLAHAGLFFNFYGKKALPKPFQKLLELYTNFFGLIIWRVFSVDVVNFFILIYQKNRITGEKSLYSEYGWKGGFRYSHVGESICVTSLFTTLKYYSSNPEIFKARVLRYAKTVPCPSNCLIEFEYISIKKENNKFNFVPVAIYTVDLQEETIAETILDESVSVKDIHKTSPVHEGGRPGSYVPLGG